METLITTYHTTPASVADFARWKDALEAQTRAFFDYNQTEVVVDTESTVSALLLWEFEQAQARSAGRLTTDTLQGRTMSEFIFRDASGKRAEERFQLQFGEHGELVRGVCQTDFGLLEDPLYQIWAQNDGTFGCEVLQHKYHEDETVSYVWRSLAGDETQAILSRFGAESTKSFEVYWQRIEAEDGSQEAADASARAISARLGRRILQAADTESEDLLH